MPYRFQATTGNIVRPIEASCLNTSTGALITPMKYGPGAITMWNGVVEYYSTTTRPTAATGGSSYTTYTSTANAYDGSGTSTYATQTTLKSFSAYTGAGTFTGMGTTNGTLHVAISTSTTEEMNINGDTVYPSVTIYYSKNGGSTWTILGSASSSSELYYTTPLTATISGATGDVQVRVETTCAGMNGLIDFKVSAPATAYIYDIWIS